MKYALIGQFQVDVYALIGQFQDLDLPGIQALEKGKDVCRVEEGLLKDPGEFVKKAAERRTGKDVRGGTERM